MATSISSILDATKRDIEALIESLKSLSHSDLENLVHVLGLGGEISVQKNDWEYWRKISELDIGVYFGKLRYDKLNKIEFCRLSLSDELRGILSAYSRNKYLSDQGYDLSICLRRCAYIVKASR